MTIALVALVAFLCGVALGVHLTSMFFAPLITRAHQRCDEALDMLTAEASSGYINRTTHRSDAPYGTWPNRGLSH